MIEDLRYGRMTAVSHYVALSAFALVVAIAISALVTQIGLGALGIVCLLLGFGSRLFFNTDRHRRPPP